MKKYFIYQSGRSIGPFTFEELRNMRIQQTTPVWFDGLGNWKNAGDILELKGLFTANPQTFYQQQNFSNPASRSTSTFTSSNLSGNTQDNSRRNMTLIIIGIVLAVCIGGGVFGYLQYQRQQRMMEESLREVEYEAEREEEQAKAQASYDSLNAVISDTEVGVSEDLGSSVYAGSFNNYTGGILIVKGNSANNLEITLSYHTSGGCVGEVSGTGKETEENQVVMRTSDGCKLTIKYSTGFVMVAESGACSSDHGSDCPFDGLYSKE